MSQTAKLSQSRVTAIDLVRVLAMTLMVWDHTLDAVLSPVYQQARYYDVWLFCRGLTAPMFLTLSGFSFALATLRHWEQHTVISPAVWRRIRRFGFFVLLGYAMHFPVHSFREIGAMPGESWQAWLQVDVLQMIGITLILLEGLVSLARTPRRFQYICFGLGGTVALLAPLSWASGLWSHVPMTVSAYFSGSTGSLFPLVPWAAYPLIGAGVGTLYSRSRRESSLPFARVLMLVGIGVGFCGWLLEGAAMRVYGMEFFWQTTPTLILMRIGIVFCLLGIAFHLSRIVPLSAGTLQSLAEESLLVYAVHVCLVYGSIWNPGLRQTIGNVLTLPAAALWAAALVFSMMFTAFLWNRCKKHQPWPSFAIRTAVYVLAAWSVY